MVIPSYPLFPFILYLEIASSTMTTLPTNKGSQNWLFSFNMVNENYFFAQVYMVSSVQKPLPAICLTTSTTLTQPQSQAVHLSSDMSFSSQYEN